MSEPSQAGIVVESVSRSFGTVQAVRDASFTAEPGAVTALIGPNGSGKTTLMLMLASLLAPDTGRIRVAGFDPLADAESVRRSLGWMPDVLGSWPSLTVRATLEITGRMYRMTPAASIDRAAELIDLVDLRELADRPTRVLSRGQKQRLSLGRALVHDPQVLVLDEPASGLDPGARIRLRELVRSFAAAGKTVLVSSHVLAELDEMADAAVYLERGVTAAPGRLQAARSSVRPWRIRGEGVVRALAEQGYDDVSHDRGDVLVHVADESAAADLLAALISGGARISAFAPAVGDLEQAFLDLSTEGAR